jgi:hypothetical protein
VPSLPSLDAQLALYQKDSRIAVLDIYDVRFCIVNALDQFDTEFITRLHSGSMSFTMANASDTRARRLWANAARERLAYATQQKPARGESASSASLCLPL